MVEVDADLPLAYRGKLPEDDPDEGPTEKREQRLRDVVRHRPEPLAETGCGEEYVEGYLGHGIHAGVRRQEPEFTRKTDLCSSSVSLLLVIFYL
jgi:hypothetical protein